MQRRSASAHSAVGAIEPNAQKPIVFDWRRQQLNRKQTSLLLCCPCVDEWLAEERSQRHLRERVDVQAELETEIALEIATEYETAASQVVQRGTESAAAAGQARSQRAPLILSRQADYDVVVTALFCSCQKQKALSTASQP
jgi:hypothetical protein